MKKRILGSVLWWVVLVGCGGNLSDEQRKVLREGKKLQEIRKVTDAQLTAAAFELGRGITATLQQRDSKRVIDSLEQQYDVRILKLTPGDSLALAIERQIIEAYVRGAAQVKLQDNVQRAGADSLIYTQPVMRERPDGTSEFLYALTVRIPKRYLILHME